MQESARKWCVTGLSMINKLIPAAMIANCAVLAQLFFLLYNPAGISSSLAFPLLLLGVVYNYTISSHILGVSTSAL